MPTLAPQIYGYSHEPEIAFLQGLNAYNQSPGTDLQLDWARVFAFAMESFYWKGIALPASFDTTFLARQTKEFTVSVAPGTFPLWITGYSSLDDGFNLNIVDMGTKTPLFSKGFGRGGNVALPMLDSSLVTDVPTGPHFILGPFPITDPGQLQVEMTNLGSATATIQAMLSCAVPIHP